MVSTPKTYNTLGYFNLARGFGILMIMLGHSVSPFMMSSASGVSGLFSNAGNIFGGGVLAMFFMISGIGFYIRKPKRCLTIQTRMLLKPYYLVGLSIFAMRMGNAIVKGRPLFASLTESLLPYLLGMNAENLGALFGEPIRSVTVMWFVMALYVGWIIYNYICRLQNSIVKTLLVALCVTLGWMLTDVSNGWPFCLPMGLITVGYLSAGYQIKQKQQQIGKFSPFFTIIMVVIILLSCAFGHVDMGAGVWKAGPLDVSATFCIGILLLRGYGWFMERNFHHPILSVLEWVGNRSIWILALHAFEKSSLPWSRFHNLFPEHPVIGTILCFALRAALIWMLHSVASKIKRHKVRSKKPKIQIDL